MSNITYSDGSGWDYVASGEFISGDYTEWKYFKKSGDIFEPVSYFNVDKGNGEYFVWVDSILNGFGDKVELLIRLV